MGDALVVRCDCDRGPDEWVSWTLDSSEVQQLAVWLVARLPENVFCDPKGPTLGQQLTFFARSHAADGKKNGAIHTWLANQLGVTVMTAGRYLNDKAIPIPDIANRIADLVGWTHEEMAMRCSEQRIRLAIQRREQIAMKHV